MLRGQIYRTSTFRTGGGVMAGTGTLNIEDYKNYMSSFLLISDTGNDFILNGQLVSGSTGIVIRNSGYYEAVINDISGNPILYHFCFFTDSVTDLDFSSDFTKLTDLDYKYQNTNNTSNVFVYAEWPMVAKVSDDSSPVNAGIIGPREFYRQSAGQYSSVFPFKNRYVNIYNDPVIWRAGYNVYVGDLYRPTVKTAFCYICTQDGTTNATEPVWPKVADEIITDNTAKWKCIASENVLLHTQRMAI